jgi:hypothetical protein
MQAVRSAFRFCYGEKVSKHLDPISVLCTLALKTLELQDGYKPVVRNNAFYMEKNGWTRSFLGTAIENVSSNDLAYLLPAITLVTKWFKAASSKELATIAKVAIVGLRQIGADYTKEARDFSKQCENAPVVCEYYSTLLENWLNEAPVEAPLILKERDAAIKHGEEFLIKAKASNQANNPAIAVFEALLLQFKGEKAKDENVLSEEDALFIKKVCAIWGDDLKLFSERLVKIEDNGPHLLGLVETKRHSFNTL